MVFGADGLVRQSPRSSRNRYVVPPQVMTLIEELPTRIISHRDGPFRARYDALAHSIRI